jgi:hypothetical protein
MSSDSGSNAAVFLLLFIVCTIILLIIGLYPIAIVTGIAAIIIGSTLKD